MAQPSRFFAESRQAGKSPHTLLFITNHFPYGSGESFIENEIDYLTARFSKVIVVARTGEKNTRKNYSGFITDQIDPKSSFTEKLFIPFLFIAKWKQVRSLLAAERKLIGQKGKKITAEIRKIYMHDLYKGLVTAHRLEKILKKNRCTGSVILYAYWMNTGSLAAALVRYPKAGLTRVSRGHGSDIYEYLHPQAYLSFRTVLCTTLDRVFTISDFGKQQLTQWLPSEQQNKVVVSRLGTTRIYNENAEKETPFVLLSCSNMIPLKRLHYIVEALALINGVKIHWIHMGDGRERKNIELLALEKLSEKQNIRYTFTGQVPHSAIKDFYAHHHIDLFINTSSTEGIPVSIMEALSCGIPVIAGKVGAIAEIVNDENGRLLPADARAEDFSAAIMQILTLAESDRQKLRANAVDSWKKNYSAEINYNIFIDQLMELAADK